MSQWTHVCGVIRYDDLRKVIMRPEFREMGEASLQIPVPDMPSGSEGPLTATWTFGQSDFEGYSYMSSLTIFGDLRDFGAEDVSEITDWWTAATTNLPQLVTIRQGVLQIQIEGVSETIILQIAPTP